MDSIFNDLSVSAIKTGMLANAAIINEVADVLAGQGAIPFVLDPVMVATSGDPLLAKDAVASLTGKLLPLATLITPNLSEAASLLDTTEAVAPDEMVAHGQALIRIGARAVLVKGGHAVWQKNDAASDVLVTADGNATWFSAPRVVTANTHGTGCTLASAIAAVLAQGETMAEAVTAAKAYLSRALEAGRDLHIGSGHGPVDHLVD